MYSVKQKNKPCPIQNFSTKAKKVIAVDREIEIKLYELLIKHKMTYQELAAKTGLSLSSISSLVNNKTERIPKNALCKIADVFELDDIRDLIDFKKNK